MVRTRIQGVWRESVSKKVREVLRADWKQGRTLKCQWVINLTIAAWVLLMVVVVESALQASCEIEGQQKAAGSRGSRQEFDALDNN